MRIKNRLFWMGGLLVGAVALGCQAAPQVVPSGPRMVVHYGAVKLEPDADMAVVFNRLDCKESDYALQQASGPDPRVDHIVVEITGTGLVVPLVKTLTRSQFTGCDATLNLQGLAPGQYEVRFTSYNAASDPVAYANGSATVALGTTPQLNLVCDFNMGSLDVNIHCCGSTAPSTAPSPVPSATATPTPTPTPPVPNPAPLMSLIHGLQADVDGNVYLFGADRSLPQITSVYARGTVIKVAPDGTMLELPGAKLGPVIYEGDIDSAGRLQAYSGGDYSHQQTFSSHHRLTMDLDTGNFTANNFTTIARGSVVNFPWAASALDTAGKLLIAPGFWQNTTLPSFDIIREPGVLNVWSDPNLLVYKFGQGGTVNGRPLSLVWDNDDGPTGAGRPIWSSFIGIHAANEAPTSTTTNYTQLVSDQTYGLAKVDDNATGVLYTRYRDNDHSVYYTFLDADKDGDPSTNGVVEEVAFTFANNAVPLRIEKRARSLPDDGDNTYYVLLIEQPIVSHYAFPGKQQIRVAKMTFDPVTHKLTAEPRPIVDSFSDPSPSW